MSDPPPSATPHDTFRDRFPRLVAQPSARAQPIATQAALRFEEPPVGRTAREARALGFVVPMPVPDDAVLDDDPLGNPPVDTASTGRHTGYAWNIPWPLLAAWFTARPEVLTVMTPAELETAHRFALAARTAEGRASARVVVAFIEAEARRREDALARAHEGALDAAVAAGADPLMA